MIPVGILILVNLIKWHVGEIDNLCRSRPLGKFARVLVSIEVDSFRAYYGLSCSCVAFSTIFLIKRRGQSSLRVGILALAPYRDMTHIINN